MSSSAIAEVHVDELDNLFEAMKSVPRNELAGAFRRIHERKTRPAPEHRAPKYDETRRALIEYERMIRGYSERVGRFLDAVRRQDRLEWKRASLVPQLILRIVGPVEGRSGARFVVLSERSARAEISLRPRWFKTRDGAREAMPRVDLEPRNATVAPGERAVVTMYVDFEGTGFPPNEIIDGEVAVEVAGEPVMLIGIEAQLEDGSMP